MDNSEVILRESDSMILVDTNQSRIDKAGREFLGMHFNLGGRGFSRRDIYETDRY